MLISFQKIIEKYELDIKTVLHIGAHAAEEHDAYFSNGCQKVVWVEANPVLCEALENRLDKQKNIIISSAVADEDGKNVDFIITNNGQSSSILELGIHKSLFPSVVEKQRVKVQTKKISTIFKENGLQFEEIDFINIDIQGAELLALKGMPTDLKNVKAIFTEINTDKVYQNCALVEEIDQFLKPHGFYRAETIMWQNHPWGDALYVKE